ncbi:MAG: signal peptidase I [Moraxella sp.]|nr:signal peptidase I [Moraxella sp.]
MEFDINLILVPVTLVFLLVWLLDKFVFKQHKLAAAHDRRVAMAQSHLADAEKDFKAVLEQAGHHEAPSEFIGDDKTPQTLLNASIAYQEAKRSLVHAQGGVATEPVKEFAIVRWAYEFLPVLLFLVVVRSFIIEPFNIPSSSMVPSLYTGDFIVVNKSAYGLRLPITHTKVLSTGEPKHGDVVVFRYPKNPKRYYIKRMIGLPGDTVAYDNGVLSINGTQVATQKTDYAMAQPLIDKVMPTQIGTQKLSDDERANFGQEEERYARYYTENLGEHTYTVRYVGDLNSSQMGEFLKENSPVVLTSGGTKWQITVPDGQYFVMGDNRDRSEDSRFWGFVPEENLAGKATYIWMHKEAGFSMPSFGRAGKID